MTEPPRSDALLDAVAEHWDSIAALAGPQRAAELRRLIEGSTEPDPVEARAALADDLLDLLPEGHPVLSLLRSGVMYDIGIERDITPAELTAQLKRLSVRIGLAAPAPARADLDWFDRTVRARLLALPALAPTEVAVHDSPVGRPATGPLIRLPAADGSLRMPAFQFADRVAIRLVEEVNAMLDAEADPWGAACWWTDEHARLGGAPAQLLGTAREAAVRAAAVELVSD
jgi:hypothetical protein